MYNYYKSQIQPIIDIQKEDKDKYKAKIKIVAGGDYPNIKTNYMDISIKQLEKILNILSK